MKDNSANLSQTIRYRSGSGYDHNHFQFVPLKERPNIIWPNGSKDNLVRLSLFRVSRIGPSRRLYSRSKMEEPWGATSQII